MHESRRQAAAWSRSPLDAEALVRDEGAVSTLISLHISPRAVGAVFSRALENQLHAPYSQAAP